MILLKLQPAFPSCICKCFDPPVITKPGTIKGYCVDACGNSLLGDTLSDNCGRRDISAMRQIGTDFRLEA